MSALAFFHEKNIAHRDLKPENILVDMNSPHYATKVIDFGFAAQSTQKLSVWCGTPAYMSPEMCKKQKYNGPATDIWALGIMLYTMLFGQQPFKGSSEADLYKKVIKGEYKLSDVAENDTFTQFPDIANASQIKNLLEDILQVKEEDRITAKNILSKYNLWLE